MNEEMNEKENAVNVEEKAEWLVNNALVSLAFIHKRKDDYRKVIPEAIAYVYYSTATANPHEFVANITEDLLDISSHLQLETMRNAYQSAIKAIRFDGLEDDSPEVNSAVSIFYSTGMSFPMVVDALRCLSIAYIIAASLSNAEKVAPFFELLSFRKYLTEAIDSEKVKNGWTELFGNKTNSIN